MAYSDYGGYAYRNGQRMVERSDYTLTPDGGFVSTGAWPGFAALLQGKPHDEALKIASYPNGHAVLGDGPIFVCLYKQSSLNVYRGLEPVPLLDIAMNLPAGAVVEYSGTRYFEPDYYKRTEEPCVLHVDGHRITAYFREEDNHYQYVELLQPDGVVWHGWSGYGVGAGLEDCGYGFSTADREAEVWQLFNRPTVTVSGSRYAED